MAKNTPLILAGDIGGTKTLLSIVTITEGSFVYHNKERYSSQEYHSLEEVIRIYLRKHPQESKKISACFALAGPIRNGHCQITNLPWELREGEVKKAFGFRSVTFINDFEAVGYSLSELGEDDVFTLQEGEATPKGPVAVLGAGTGLGEAFMTFSETREHYVVHPSEGGHSSFSPRNEIEIDFLRRLLMETDHVDYDAVLSGAGLVRMYNHLLEKERKTLSESTQRAMKGSDPAAVIAGLAIAEEDMIAERALDMFVCIYGAEASNFALKVFSTGGVYVAGGMAPKIIEKLKGGRFMKNFLEKGKHQELLKTFPVKVVLNEEAGLIGAAAVARQNS